MIWALITLSAVVVLQQIHIHKLLNKLMSRNYGEYVQAHGASAPRVQVHDHEREPPEDLDALSEF